MYSCSVYDNKKNSYSRKAVRVKGIISPRAAVVPNDLKSYDYTKFHCRLRQWSHDHPWQRVILHGGVSLLHGVLFVPLLHSSNFYIYMSSILVTIHSDHFLTLYHFLRKLSLIFLNIFMYISYVYLVLDYRTRREGPIPTLLSLSSQAAAIKGLSNDGKCC